jgi:nicotinamide-nucleotide adenylyltransferase
VDRGRIREVLDRARRPGPPRLEVLDGSPSEGVVGLVPGSFDPMTVAHVGLAEAMDADLALFLYSPATLQKETGPGGSPEPPLLSEEDRVASVLAVVGPRPGRGVAVCSHGLLADQAEAAARAFPRAALVFGVGSDKIRQLLDPRWYRDRDTDLSRLFSLAEVAFAVRSGDDGPDPVEAAGAPWGSRIRRLDLDPRLAGISSRAVRAALRRGQDVTDVVPAEVLPFLRREGA